MKEGQQRALTFIKAELGSARRWRPQHPSTLREMEKALLSAAAPAPCSRALMHRPRFFRHCATAMKTGQAPQLLPLNEGHTFSAPGISAFQGKARTTKPDGTDAGTVMVFPPPLHQMGQEPQVPEDHRVQKQLQALKKTQCI